MIIDKRYIKLILFIISFFCLNMVVCAENKYIVLNDAVYIRKGASTSYEAYTLGNLGSTYYLKSLDIVPDEAQNDTCNNGWYHINYNDLDAYVCSTYVSLFDEVVEEENREPVNSCEEEMMNLGFPSTYWQGLCSIKSNHPTWVFKPIITGLEWTTVVSKESACGKSLIQTSNSEYLDSTCSKTDGGFKAASQKAVAFYMDPRNFLTDKYIFQFEYLKYDDDLANDYLVGIKGIINNAAFFKYHVDLGTDLSLLINSAGKTTNVSPMSIAARMYQELGASTSLYNLYSGVYTGHDNNYYGYYNFFNIGISGECNNLYGTSFCGLNYAKNSNWNSVSTAIEGGARFLGDGYINRGQYTLYLQKYNVVPTDSSKLYIHQYMTNIAAPASEAISTYNSYNKANLLDKSFAFYIPVYINMGAKITNTPSGIINNPLPAPSEDEANEEIVEVVYPSAISVITTSGYKIDDKNVFGFNVGLTVEELKVNLEAIGGTGRVVITNNNNEVINDGIIKTGYKIKIKSNEDEETFTIIINGDTSGDGLINALDLLQIQKSILGTYNLDSVYKLAADVSKDGAVNALDLLQVQKSILGTYKIEQ